MTSVSSATKVAGAGNVMGPAKALARYLHGEWVQVLGVLSAGLGAGLLAFASATWSPWGWALYLLSNAALIVMAKQKRIWGLLLLQLYFCITSAAGVYRYLIDAGQAQNLQKTEVSAKEAANALVCPNAPTP